MELELETGMDLIRDVWLEAVPRFVSGDPVAKMG